MLAALVLPLGAQYFEVGPSRPDAERHQRQRDFVEDLERDHDRFKQQEAYDQRKGIPDKRQRLRRWLEPAGSE